MVCSVQYRTTRALLEQGHDGGKQWKIGPRLPTEVRVESPRRQRSGPTDSDARLHTFFFGWPGSRQWTDRNRRLHTRPICCVRPRESELISDRERACPCQCIDLIGQGGGGGPCPRTRMVPGQGSARVCAHATGWRPYSDFPIPAARVVSKYHVHWQRTAAGLPRSVSRDP